jgi:hypothetical protein
MLGLISRLKNLRPVFVLLLEGGREDGLLSCGNAGDASRVARQRASRWAMGDVTAGRVDDERIPTAGSTPAGHSLAVQWC